MRIGVDARPLATPFNGIGRYTSALLEQMTTTGHEWFLYSNSAIETTLGNLSNVTVRCGNTHTKSPLSLIYTQNTYKQWMKLDAVDVFWSPRHHLPIQFTRSAAQVVTIHDTVWKRLPGTMPTGARLLEMMLMPRAVKQSTSIICVSQFTASEVKSFWPAVGSKVHVIYSGGLSAIPQRRVAAASLGFSYVLSVGTPEPRKNLPRLLQAYALLKAKHVILEKLVIVGADGWGDLDLQNITDSLALSEDVLFKGRVSDAELGDLYSGASCFVFPSLYEGFGLPAVEAMQYGLPVVASDRGALPEVCGDAALLCDPTSVDSIACALAKVLTDKDIHNSLSRNAFARAAFFDWKTAASQTLDVLLSAGRRACG
ncbi:bifunctional glycosyltransferase [gamma proteobacterium NOR5-3]|nr:bifunctional glycosyltransferase [gamma proteobacterium NOR5-3]